MVAMKKVLRDGCIAENLKITLDVSRLTYECKSNLDYKQKERKGHRNVLLNALQKV